IALSWSAKGFLCGISYTYSGQLIWRYVMLKQAYQRAMKNNGEFRFPRKADRTSSTYIMKRYVEQACQVAHYGRAIEADVIGDHRVIGTLNRVSEDVSRVILRVEENLGRKLSRERAGKLINGFLKIRQASQAQGNIVQFVPRKAA